MNGMADTKQSGWVRWGRDAVLLAAFAAVIVWSLFFTIVRPGSGVPGVAGQPSGASYKGEIVVRVRMPEAGWSSIHIGDRMGDSAVVTKMRVREVKWITELLMTIKVTGPIEFTTERYPFPQRTMPLRVGSVIWFETPRYSLIGDVVAMNP